jgi:hypothetical protein
MSSTRTLRIFCSIPECPRPKCRPAPRRRYFARLLYFRFKSLFFAPARSTNLSRHRVRQKELLSPSMAWFVALHIAANLAMSPSVSR